MSIKVLTRKARQAMTYDGSSMAKAVTWSTISSSGTSGSITQFFSNAAWIAVTLTGGTTYTSNYGDDMGNSVQLYNEAGTKVAESTFDWGEWALIPLSYTPASTGVYYLKYTTEWWEEGQSVSVNFSPRPADVSRPTYAPSETSDGFDDFGFPKRYRNSGDANILPGAGEEGLIFKAEFGSGSAQDMSPRHASITNYDVSVANGVAEFNGYSSYLQFPTQSGDLSGDFTIELWVSAQSVSKYAIVSGEGDCRVGIATFQNYWGMWAGTGSRWDIMQCDEYGESNGTPDGIGSIAVTTGWHHVAMVRDGSAYRLYVDGVLAKSVTDSTDVVMGGASMNIGMWGASGDRIFFSGSVDDCKVYDYAKYTSAFTPPERSAS